MFQKLFLGFPKYFVTWLIISIWSKSSSADVKGKVSISYSVAQAVCSSTVKVARSIQIERPSKSSALNNAHCKTLIWNNCEPSVTGAGTGAGATACQKFKLKACPSKRRKHTETKTWRIVNGTDAEPHEFPHVVRITFRGQPHCDGTILNENYIVTAAHCLYLPFVQSNAAPADYEVIAADHNSAVDEGVEQIRGVKKVVWHDDFPTVGNDIGLMLLEQPLELTENIFPPKMPEPDYDGTGKVVTVIGWGLLAEDGDLADILQKVDLTILSGTDCDAALAGILSTPEGTFCAAAGEGGKTSCSGDSGGPATMKVENCCDLFVGIVSFGVNCYDPYPSVYTQVSKYIDWIRTKAGTG